MFKNIVKNLEPSSTLKINEISKELERSGKKIYKFGFGQSPFAIPSNVVEALKKNASHNMYLPMQGLCELIEAIAKFVSTKKNYEYHTYSKYKKHMQTFLKEKDIPSHLLEHLLYLLNSISRCIIKIPYFFTL